MSGNLGRTDCPEGFDPFAAAEVHFGNEDRSIGVDSFNNRYVAKSPSVIGPCIRLYDCTDGWRVVDCISCTSCSVIPVVCIAPVVAHWFTELLAAFENVPSAVAPVVVVGAV